MSTFMQAHQNLSASGKSANVEIVDDFDLHAIPQSRSNKVNDQLLHQFEQGLLNQHKSATAGAISSQCGRSAVVAGGSTVSDNVRNH